LHKKNVKLGFIFGIMRLTLESKWRKRKGDIKWRFGSDVLEEAEERNSTNQIAAWTWWFSVE